MDDDVDALELDVDAFHDGPVHRRKVRRLLVDVDIRHRQEAGVLVVGVRSVEDVKVGEKGSALDAAHLEIADDVVGSKLGFGCQRIHAEEEDLFVELQLLHPHHVVHEEPEAHSDQDAHSRLMQQVELSLWQATLRCYRKLPM